MCCHTLRVPNLIDIIWDMGEFLSVAITQLPPSAVFQPWQSYLLSFTMMINAVLGRPKLKL
jgi:hypothetical protein